MKTWRYIRRTLWDLGYTRATVPDNNELIRIDDDAYLYFTDEDGDEVKAQQGDALATLVDSNTTDVYVTPSGGTESVTGGTQQLAVVNQDGTNVISECTFSTDTPGVATVNATGLVTYVGNIGTAVITADHEDDPSDTYDAEFV